MSAIRLTDLTLGYDRHPAVHHLSGEVATGSLTAIVGPNGAGKSTLLKGITGTLTPLSGGVSIAKGKRLAYLPQSAELDRSFPIHVYDLVAMGLWNRAGIFGRIGASAAHKVEHAIAAGRRGEDVPEELDVSTLGDISEEEWRAYWTPAVEDVEPDEAQADSEPQSEDTEPAPDRIPEPTPADVPEPAPVEVPMITPPVPVISPAKVRRVAPVLWKVVVVSRVVIWLFTMASPLPPALLV